MELQSVGGGGKRWAGGVWLEQLNSDDASAPQAASLRRLYFSSLLCDGGRCLLVTVGTPLSTSPASNCPSSHAPPETGRGGWAEWGEMRLAGEGERGGASLPPAAGEEKRGKREDKEKKRVS